LRTDIWGKLIAKQLDKDASSVQIDPVGGFLSARITIDVNKPLRRGMLIDSTKRKSTNWYEIEYEQIPHFCFSCGRLGHSDLFCLVPGSRDANGNLPFGPELRAADRKKSGSADNSSREKSFSQNSRHASNFSKTTLEPGVEVISPEKRTNQNKRKGVQTQKEYKKVVQPVLAITDGGGAGKDLILCSTKTDQAAEGFEQDHLKDEEPKKKKPTRLTLEI
jgi:hypothetical protein